MMDKHAAKNIKKKNKTTAVICIELLAIIVIVAAVLFFSDKELPWSRQSEQVQSEDSKVNADNETNDDELKGYVVRDGKAYFYKMLGIPAKKGWIRTEKGDFYCLGDGELATGWKYLDKRAYYFYRESDVAPGKLLGKMAKNDTTDGYIDIPETGYLDGEEGLAIGYSLDVLERFGWNLESAYRYSAALGFVPGADAHYGFTIHSCANQGFKYGEGNCLAWSGTFCAMAKVMGYDARLIWGTLPWQGRDVPHAWVEIWMDDGIHVYDPRKNDGEDMAGFDVRYGEPGTRKYNEDSKEYLEW